MPREPARRGGATRRESSPARAGSAAGRAARASGAPPAAPARTRSAPRPGSRTASPARAARRPSALRRRSAKPLLCRSLYSQQVGADFRRGERLRRIQRVDPLDESLEVAWEIDQEGDRAVDDVPGRRRAVQQVLRELQLARHRCSMRIGALASEMRTGTPRFLPRHLARRVKLMGERQQQFCLPRVARRRSFDMPTNRTSGKSHTHNPCRSHTQPRAAKTAKKPSAHNKASGM